MNIIISAIRISGFRGINNLEVNFSKTTLLVGQNNSGKTSVLKALQLALSDYSRYLTIDDFYINPSGQRSQEIIIDTKISPTSKNEDGFFEFEEEWLAEFGDKTKADLNNNQFVCIRTRVNQNSLRTGFETSRFSLNKWPLFENWLIEDINETLMPNRVSGIDLISIDAQRDIHQDLKERSSFMHKLLANVKYNDQDISEIESLIQRANDEAIQRSTHLQKLKEQLDGLNNSFQGFGSTDITPFPKKIRDLSKNFTIHFGESSTNLFSMEYHGMGTRSWASMLAVKAFASLVAQKHAEEFTPFFPVMIAEEPEAHLHPSAQKTIYSQLNNSDGQVLISTHSPYVVAMASLQDLVYLNKVNDKIEAKRLPIFEDSDDERRLYREILQSRGEIIFARKIVLCEGETEAQALPLLFKKYFEKEPFELGVNFIGVGGSGARYLPFLYLSKYFSIPIYIFSDGEPLVLSKLESVYRKVFDIESIGNCQNIIILENTDFEGYLLSSGYQEVIVDAIKDLFGDTFIENWMTTKQGTVKSKEKQQDNICTECNQPKLNIVLRDYNLDDGYLMAVHEILDSKKTSCAPAIAEKLCLLDNNRLPSKIIELFDIIGQEGVTS